MISTLEATSWQRKGQGAREVTITPYPLQNTSRQKTLQKIQIKSRLDFEVLCLKGRQWRWFLKFCTPIVKPLIRLVQFGLKAGPSENVHPAKGYKGACIEVTTKSQMKAVHRIRLYSLCKRRPWNWPKGAILVWLEWWRRKLSPHAKFSSRRHIPPFLGNHTFTCAHEQESQSPKSHYI